MKKYKNNNLIHTNNCLFDDLIIFEMANSHQGILEHGINIIKTYGEIAKKYNIKGAIKLQYRDLETFIHPNYRESELKHIQRFISTRLTKNDFDILVAEIKKQNLLAIATPFDESSVELCVKQDLDIIKIASCSAKDFPLLEKIASSNKPIIVSTGGLSIDEIDNLYNFFIHKNATFAILHCVSIYPCPKDLLQLDIIDKFHKRYPNIAIGYSGHENPNDEIIPHMVIAKGAKILERHIGLPIKDITLNSYSMNPQQAEKWVQSILSAREICKFDKEKKITKEEVESLESLMRGVYAKKDLKKNQILKSEDVFFAMPLQNNQLTSGEFIADSLTTSQSYKMFDFIVENNPKDSTIKRVRKIIHKVKGMINESNIKLGNDFNIELSHHCGLENFEKFGCVIVNIINREYCKKLICMLPNQKHPDHFHKQKEETFQVLFGEMELIINQKERIIRTEGELQLIERNTIHAFNATEKGLIFEEISTTSLKSDSYYIDSKISSLDPIERKTFLSKW